MDNKTKILMEKYLNSVAVQTKVFEHIKQVLIDQAVYGQSGGILIQWNEEKQQVDVTYEGIKQ